MEAENLVLSNYFPLTYFNTSHSSHASSSPTSAAIQNLVNISVCCPCLVYLVVLLAIFFLISKLCKSGAAFRFGEPAFPLCE